MIGISFTSWICFSPHLFSGKFTADFPVWGKSEVEAPPLLSGLFELKTVQNE